MKHSNEIIFWFDSETTGFDEKSNQMVSFAMVATDIFFNVVGTYYTFVKLNPNSVVTKSAMEVNKIDFNSPEYINGAISEDQLLKEIEIFVNKHKTPKSLCIAHNAPFDQRFLFQAFIKTQIDNFLAQTKFLCTVKYFKKLISLGLFVTTRLINKKDNSEYWSAKLEHIAIAFGIDHLAHNALGDTLTLIKCYQKGIKLEKNQDFFDIY